MILTAASSLDTWDPDSTTAPQVTATDALAGGTPVTVATVTLTVSDMSGTPFAGLTDVPMPHVGQGLYRALIAPSLVAAAGITRQTGRVRVVYRAVVPAAPDPIIATLPTEVLVRPAVDPR